ncbi:hypothetical protein EEB13_05410 [Rhodococcus sp. WS3]|uniref:hypothetical protein n=1 Tax=Rhodococcus sp. WS3 TaxID=2486271 RepID=UPI001143FFA0|nr:hypothetical protein [Rhodococcus sp. WS3]ROZ49363.1 hypothetical protein EEB13_05410 [Rhodococcus sp. WS3]
MSNEIEPYTAPSAAIAPVADSAALVAMADSLRAHVAALESADLLAGMIHMSVQAYDGGTDNKGKRRAGRKEAAIAIYHGMQLGWAPLPSLQNIFTVHGVPGMYARAMKALLISQGHEVETIESTLTSATVRARHAGTPNWEEVTWTIDIAKQAGYTSNPKYQSDPRGMLYAKALADACRRACPDVLMGMAYTVEDLELEPRKVESERVPAPKGGTAGLAAMLGTAKADPEPEPAEPVQSPASEDEIAQLVAGLAEGGITDPAEAIPFLRARTGRNEIEKSKDLTSAEIAAVLDFMVNGEPA